MLHTANYTRHDNIAALLRMWEMAQHDHGGANVAAKLLLGLYNGARFPFDLTELRRLDEAAFEDAMLVIRLDSPCLKEVHEILNDHFGVRNFGNRFEHLAHAWRLKGRCKKEYLRPIEAQAA